MVHKLDIWFYVDVKLTACVLKKICKLYCARLTVRCSRLISVDYMINGYAFVLCFLWLMHGLDMHMSLFLNYLWRKSLVCLTYDRELFGLSTTFKSIFFHPIRTFSVLVQSFPAWAFIHKDTIKCTDVEKCCSEEKQLAEEELDVLNCIKNPRNRRNNRIHV